MLTGPSSSDGGYFYCETSSPRTLYDNFLLTYDGSDCAAYGLPIGKITFDYHMYAFPHGRGGGRVVVVVVVVAMARAPP